MNRRMFIASMIGSLVSLTGKINVRACQLEKIEPAEVADLYPRLLHTTVNDVQIDSTQRPITSGAPFDALVESIRKYKGILKPITINYDFTIIDGVHRVEACKKAGVTDIYAYQVKVTKEELYQYLISMNSRRI